MNKRILAAALLCILAVIAVLVSCSSGAERQIRKQLDTLEELVSFESEEGNISSLTKAKRLGSLFTEDVVINLGMSGIKMTRVLGREQVQQAAMAARSQATSLRTSLHDITVEIASDKQSAQVEATGRATIAGEPQPIVQDFIFEFEETEDGWLIGKVQQNEALR